MNEATIEMSSVETLTKANTHSLRAIYEMTKPGITKMVVMSSITGYVLALKDAGSYFSEISGIAHLLLTVLGITLVSSGSCILNNAIEHSYDKLMNRTKNRPIPAGKIMPTEAVIAGLIISLLGLVMLVFINTLTAILALVTLVTYVGIYTPMKRVTSLATLVGGIPGALPIAGGWTALTGTFSIEAAVLFLVLFFWQIPHFLSLSWMYREDYARGGFPMLSVLDADGSMVARQSLVYVVALIPATAMLYIVNATGIIYLAGSLLFSVAFLYFAVRFQMHKTNINARKLLLSSYIFLLGFFALIFIDKIR